MYSQYPYYPCIQGYTGTDTLRTHAVVVASTALPRCLALTAAVRCAVVVLHWFTQTPCGLLLGCGGGAPEGLRPSRGVAACEGRRPSRGMRHATAHRTRACTPWLHMLRPLACYRHSVTLRTAAQGTLRHHMHAHVLVALAVPCVPVVLHTTCMRCNARHYVPLCYAQAACVSMQVHAEHVRARCALVATLPRARMLRSLACSLHECVHANAVSLLPTDTQLLLSTCWGGGQQQLREPLEVRYSTPMHR